MIVKSLDLLLSFRFCHKITLDLLPSFSFCRKIRIYNSLIIKGLQNQPPCARKSLILSILQEVSKMQTTRRDVVKKSLSQKVFLLTIFHSEPISFFIYFEKNLFHLVSFIFWGFVETSNEVHRSIFSFFTFFKKFGSHFDFGNFIIKS